MKKFLFLAGLCLAASGLRAQAVALAYDNFNTGSGGYLSGSNLITQNPATYGFTGAWTGATTGDFNATSSVNLTLPGLANGGGALSLFSFANGYFSRAVSRSFTASSAGNTSFWAGSLFQVPSSNTAALTPSNQATNMIGFLSGALPTFTTPNGNSGNQTLALWSTSNGNTLDGFAYGIQNGVLTLAYQNSGVITYVNPTATITAGTTYWLLANLTVVAPGSDTLNFYLETSVPSDAALALQTPTYSVTANILGSLATDTSGLNTLELYAGGASVSSGGPALQTYFDDVGAATSFDDLVAAPEPSTLALMVTCLIGAVAFGAFRRRLSFV